MPAYALIRNYYQSDLHVTTELPELLFCRLYWDIAGFGFCSSLQIIRILICMRAKDNWFDELFEVLCSTLVYVTKCLVLSTIQVDDSERKVIRNCEEITVYEIIFNYEIICLYLKVTFYPCLVKHDNMNMYRRSWYRTRHSYPRS